MRALVALVRALRSDRRSPRAADVLEAAICRSALAVRLLVMLERDQQEAGKKAAALVGNAPRMAVAAKKPPPGSIKASSFGSDLDRRRVTGR